MTQAEATSHSSRRTVLLASSASVELANALRNQGLDVTRWPQLQIRPPDSFHLLDEAIENLFGYDWVIFISQTSVTTFLDRFLELEHKIDELDSSRVCAIGESTLTALEKRQVHVDVVARQFGATRVVKELTAYIGGPENFARLNFLIPQAVIGRGYLKPALEDNGARSDVVTAYQTVSRSDALRLVSLLTILSTGGIDCVIFASSAEVMEFGQVFDTLDLSNLLTGRAVACKDGETATAAKEFGVSATIIGQSSPSKMAEAVAARLLS